MLIAQSNALHSQLPYPAMHGLFKQGTGPISRKQMRCSLPWLLEALCYACADVCYALQSPMLYV